MHANVPIPVNHGKNRNIETDTGFRYKILACTESIERAWWFVAETVVFGTPWSEQVDHPTDGGDVQADGF